jgi:hypothetical protein
MRLLKENAIIKALNEELSGSVLEEYCGYLYDDANGYVEDIPNYEKTTNYFFDCTKKEYNKIYNMVKTAIENVADHMYSGDSKPMIELSARHTLNNLSGNVDNVDPEESLFSYEKLRDEAFKKFEEETGVEIWQSGRSGRHIVVDDNFYNAYHYNELCEVQEKWEDWVIDEFAKKYPFNESYMGVKDADYINRGNWSDGAVRYRGFIYNAYEIQQALGDYFEEDLKDNGKEVPGDNKYFVEFDKWIKENPDKVKNEVENILYDYTPESIDQNIVSEIENEYSYKNLVKTLESWKTRTDIPENEIDDFIAMAKEHCEGNDFDEEENVAEVVNDIVAILTDDESIEKWFSMYESKKIKGKIIKESSYANNKLLDAVRDYGIVSVNLDESKQTITFRVPRATKENDGYVCATVDLIEIIEGALREMGMDVDVFGEGESATDFGTFTLTYEPKAKGLYSESSLKESSTEEYWNAKEIKRDGFVCLLKFNSGDNKYIITKDNNEVRRFSADSDEEAIKQYEKWRTAPRDGFGEYVLDESADSKITVSDLSDGVTIKCDIGGSEHLIYARWDDNFDFDEEVESGNIPEGSNPEDWGGIYFEVSEPHTEYTDGGLLVTDKSEFTVSELGKDLLDLLGSDGTNFRLSAEAQVEEPEEKKPTGKTVTVNDLDSEGTNCIFRGDIGNGDERLLINFALSSEGGIDYTIFREGGSEVDGGVMDVDANKTWDSMEEVAKELVSFQGIKNPNSFILCDSGSVEEILPQYGFINESAKTRKLKEEVTKSTSENATKVNKPGKIRNYLDYELEDDDTETGGISFNGETVRDFIGDTDMSEDDTLDNLNKALVSCGIKPISEGYLTDYRGDDYWDLSDAYVDGALDEKDLAWELIKLYDSHEAAERAFKEITDGKEMPTFDEEPKVNESVDIDNTDKMCSFIGDLFKTMAEDFKSNAESLYDWCEGGDTFRNAGYSEEDCKVLDKMLMEINPLVQNINEILFHYSGEGLSEAIKVKPGKTRISSGFDKNNLISDFNPGFNPALSDEDRKKTLNILYAIKNGKRGFSGDFEEVLNAGRYFNEDESNKFKDYLNTVGDRIAKENGDDYEITANDVLPSVIRWVKYNKEDK